MTWRSAAHYVLMWGIRYTPVSWRLKRALIRLATPRTLVVGTAIIPDSEGRVLMLRARYSGRWIPPGGALHPGEDPRSGVRRECREELGQEVELLGLIGLYTIRGELFIAFRAAPLARPPRLGPEHEAYHYLPPAELPLWVRAMAEDAARADGPPSVRSVERRD